MLKNKPVDAKPLRKLSDKDLERVSGGEAPTFEEPAPLPTLDWFHTNKEGKNVD